MATIVRGPRAADHFTIISNSALRDERLSWKARGLLAYLLSMETGWQTSVRRLATVAPDGKSAVETALAELQAAGYLERVQTRAADDKAGTFSHTEYHVCDDAAVTGLSGHGDDEPTVTRFSVDGSAVPGESATKKNSPKKTSTKEDRSAALRAATASPVETSSSSITSRNASDRDDDAAAAKASSTTRAGATRGTTPAAILRAAGLDTAAAGRFRAWLVTGTGATNPDGLIVTLRNAGHLPERLSQWRASEDPTQVPGPGRATHGTWCGDCDRVTRTAVAHDAEGREYVRRCPVCNVNAASTTPDPSRAAHGPVTADDGPTAADAYEAARAARAALPAGVRRRQLVVGNVVDIATARAAQGSDQ